MRLEPDDQVIWAPRDLGTWDRCPWAVVRHYASLTTGLWPVPELDEPLRDVMGHALVDHRQRVLKTVRAHASAVVECESHDTTEWTGHADGSSTIIQPLIRWVDPDGGFTLEARVDALVPTSHSSYNICLARLGTSSMRRRSLELAGIRQGVASLGIAVEDTAVIVAADCTKHSVELDAWEELWRERVTALAEGIEQVDSGEADLAWSTTGFDQCGREACPWCQDALASHDDLFHVARLRRSLRAELRRRGVTDMTSFAEMSQDELRKTLPDSDQDAIRRAHVQATLQVLTTRSHSPVPATEIIDATRLDALPETQPGDIYLDFEADPSYRQWPEGATCENPASGPEGWLGIDYLIGVVDGDTGEYIHWWADDYATEREAWAACVDWMQARFRNHPSAHIFHYASYERTAINRLVNRHQVGSAMVARLEDSGQFVDLYREVMGSVAVGTAGYSLKDIEALYLDGSARGGIAQGADSVLAFEDYLGAADRDEAKTLRQAIIEYNAIDCRSTRQLHHWLLAQRDRDY